MPILSLHHAVQTDEATYITSRLAWEEVEVLYRVLDGMLLHHDIETGSLQPPQTGDRHG